MINAISGGQWPGRHFRCIVRKGNAILERGSMSNIIIIKEDIHKLKLHLKIVFFVAIYCFFFLVERRKKIGMPEIGTRATVFCYREARYLKGEKKKGYLYQGNL